MAARTIKICPHCRYSLGSTVDLHKITFGSPIKVCPRCKKKYIDNDCKELALYELKFYDKMPMSLDNLIRMCILFGLGLFALAFNAGFSIALLSIVAIWLMICWIMYPAKKERIEEERQKSIQRLSNPAYAYELRSMGMNVPEKFLNPEKYKKILENETSEKSNCERCGIYLREEQFKKINGHIYCNSCFNIVSREQQNKQN